jgi:hypothetical protein
MKNKILITCVLSVLCCFFIFKKVRFLKNKSIQVFYYYPLDFTRIVSKIKNIPFIIEFKVRNDTLFHLRKYSNFNGEYLGSEHIPYWPRKDFNFVDNRNVKKYPPTMPGEIDNWKISISKIGKTRCICRKNVENKLYSQFFYFDKNLKLVKFKVNFKDERYAWPAK